MPTSLKGDVTAAMPTLWPYVATLTSAEDDMVARGLVEKFVGSRGNAMLSRWSGAMLPGERIRRHDMMGRLSVTRIQNWQICVGEL